METDNLTISYRPLGDTAIILQFKEEISRDTYALIYKIASFLEAYSFEGFVEYVPAYTSVSIFYDPLIVSYPDLEMMMIEMLQELEDVDEKEQRMVEIPVLYGGAEYGPDLELVAAYAKLSTSEVIDLHTAQEYLVQMIGFAPGFPYLGGLDQRIAVPRKENPRIKINAGSVGIAGKQTGIYPMDTPGGWQIIGRTPLRLFDIQRSVPALIRAGDTIRFVAITEDEFETLQLSTHGH